MGTAVCSAAKASGAALRSWAEAPKREARSADAYTLEPASRGRWTLAEEASDSAWRADSTAGSLRQSVLPQDVQEVAIAADTSAAARQFSLAQLWLMVSAASAILATQQFLPLRVYAFMLGVACCVALSLDELLRPRRAGIRLACWLLGAGYAAACLAAWSAS